MGREDCEKIDIDETSWAEESQIQQQEHAPPSNPWGWDWSVVRAIRKVVLFSLSSCLDNYTHDWKAKKHVWK